MKNFMALIFLGILTLTLVSSCGSKGGHCDAYGSVQSISQNNDLASK